MPSAINDVELQDLSVIPTNGGPVMHMMRPSSPLFGEIGEVYFSEVEPGAYRVKAEAQTIDGTEYLPPLPDADTERDNFLTAEEAQAYGLIDKVIYKR